MIIIEAFRGLSKYKIFSALIIIQLSFGLVLCNMVVQQKIVIDDEAIQYSPFMDGSIMYMVYDELRDQKEQDYFNEKDSQFRVQRYIDALENNAEYEYLICGQHPVQVLTTDLPESTIYGETVGLLKAHQVNKNIMLRYPIQIVDGRTFSDEDFNYNLLDIVPVILGFTHKECYTIGTRINAFYMGRPILMEVIGIAKSGTYFPIDDSLVYEDDFIIMPVSRVNNLPINANEEFLQKANALQNTSGYFRLTNEQSLADLIDYLYNMEKQFGMYEVRVGRIDLGRIVALGLSSSRNAKIFMSLAGVVLIISVIQLFVIICATVRKSARRFSILYLAGASKVYIAGVIISEVLILMFSALIISIVVEYNIQLYSVETLLLIFMLLIICGICCSAPALYQLFQSPILYLKK